MENYKSSKNKLALLRRNLKERERKLKEFQQVHKNRAQAKKIALLGVLITLFVGVVAYIAF